MTRYAWLLGALALVGCKGGKDEAATDDTGTGPSCTVTIDDTYPASDAVDFYYRAALEVEFSEAPEGATLALVDAAGNNVDGTASSSDDGTVITFTPSSSLQPSSSYTLNIDYCNGTPAINFMTSSLGSAVSPASALNDHAYKIDLASARFLEPEGIGSVLGQLLEQNILVGVVTATDTDVEMIGAISVAGTTDQDMCNPTIPFPPADFANPHFQVGPETTTISAGGVDVTIEDLSIGGDFASDGSYFGGGTLGGTVDTRPLAPLLDTSGEGGDSYVCDLVADLEYAECVPCPGDGEPYCLTLSVDQIIATDIGVGLVELSEEDVAANPDCAE